MIRILSKSLIIALFSYSLCWPTVINIPDDYPTIQQGIDASIDGDTVLVQPGIYVENINFNGHNIVLGSLFLTTEDTSYIEQTVIDGDSAGTVLLLDDGNRSTMVITGFTIRNGVGGGGGQQRTGGGITCKNNSDPTIIKNYIVLNRAGQGSGIFIHDSAPAIIGNFFYADTSQYDGGAIACLDSDPLIERNLFLRNFGDCGAAVFCGNANPVISCNVMIDNEATYLGGGIACRNESYPTIFGNSIIDNKAGIGGGVGCVNSNALIKNNIIESNDVLYAGGGIYSSDSDTLDIINNTITKNSVTGNIRYGGGLFSGISNVNIANTIFWGNNAIYPYAEICAGASDITVSYSDIDGGWLGQGNIDVAPLFRDPVNGDFHLMSIACGDSADSPCIDTGDPNILDSLLDCSWGLGGPRSDMGAYGGGNSTMTDIESPSIIKADRFTISQNYPNPFNSYTVFEYYLNQDATVNIDIYDVLGRRVETLLAETVQPPGRHSIIWKADDYPSGVYLYSIRIGGNRAIRKCLLLK